MGWKDKLNQTADKVVKQTGRAVEQGRGKLEEVQVERQMDAAARKVGYMAYDSFQGREVDAQKRQELLDEIASLEEQLEEARRQKTEEKEEGVASSTAQEPSPTSGQESSSASPQAGPPPEGGGTA